MPHMAQAYGRYSRRETGRGCPVFVRVLAPVRIVQATLLSHSDAHSKHALV